MPYLIGSILFLALCLGLVVVPAVLALRKNREVDLTTGWGMSTRYFLVLLRLVIGWHFLIEGLDKFQTGTWSSEAYLRESTGPLAPIFRDLAGDSLVDRLTPDANNQFPQALAADWDNYFDHFKAYYSLDDEQLKKANVALRQSMSKTLTWMTSDTKLIARPLPQGPPLMAPMTVPERLKDLQKKEELVRTLEQNVRPTFGEKTLPALVEAKNQARRVRAELKTELNKQTADMKKALAGALTSEQKLSPMPEPGKPVQSWSRLDWSDNIVKYGLVLVGGLLLIGLLTRTACVAGALFLLMFFLAMPPLPGWPENPRAEGHYLFINKNIIEMMALLVLATTRSGRWAGLDGLVQFLKPRRFSKRYDSEDRPPVVETPGVPTLTPQSTFVSPEKSDGT
jgi:uncharacterized membrane protein YphA (DoxX/SURF4 family)